MDKLSDKLEIFKDKINTSLEISFHEALKDDDFKELVSTIDVPKKELIKYTSELESAKEEYSHCKNCKNILSCKNKIMGYCYSPMINKDGSLYFGYQICKYKKKIDKKNKYLENVYTINEPKEIKDASMKDIITTDKKRYETIKYITKFIKEYKKDQQQKGLYLHGSFGSGKTYLIAAMFNELAKDGIKSAIIFWPEFIQELKASFGNSFNEKLDYVKRVPLLLIDDIGAENTTAWSRDEIFCPIVQYRMEEKLPTFFTSNLDMKALETHFSVSKDSVDNVKSRRIIERIKQLTIDMELISKNLRK